MQLKPSKSEFLSRQGHFKVPGGFSYWLFQAACLCMLIILSFMPIQTVFGQTDDTIQVLPPEIDNFPVVSIQFNLNSNAFTLDSDIQTDQITVIENEQPVPILSLEKVYAGVNFTLAINSARDLDLRDEFGQSIFEKLSEVLADWASSRSYHYDDTWSLVNNEGTDSLNLEGRDDWISALENYQPNFRKIEQSLVSLENSIRLASDRVVPFGVDKAILYITPPPTGEEIDHVNFLAEQAHSAGIQVNIWMVGDALFLDNDQGKALMNLAASTGGQFDHYTEPEMLPEFVVDLSQQGFFHALTYESDIRETGSYPVSLEVALQGQVFRGESTPFFIDIQPPNPMFVTPQSVVTRRVVLDGSGQENWTPDIYSIEIQVDFPDDLPREIAESRLYVDGEIVAKRTAHPFDSLTWNLAELIEPGEHTLQVEVIDEWGLSNRTLITPVQIEVDLPEPDPPFPVQRIILGAVILILAAAVVILIIWLARRGWKFPEFLRPKVQASSSSEAPTGKVTRIQNPDGKVYASLIPLDCPAEKHEEFIIPITQTRATFGNDPALASIVMNQPDIGGIQADLYLTDELFSLRDLGSPAGTWVNYHRIGTEPVRIHAGDIIHFGNSGFRFTMVGTDALTEISVSRYEPIL